MQRFRSRPVHLIAIATLALVPLACTSIFPVAVLIPESGASQAYGISVRNGVELALEELRAAGKAEHLKVDFYDTQSDPQIARQKLDELFSGDTLVAIGGVTPMEASTMVEVAEEKKRVLLSPTSSNDRLSQKAEFFYRLAISDTTAGGTMADFSHRELQLDKALLLAENADLLAGLEQGFRPAFESSGGVVTDAVLFPEDDAELKTLLTAEQVQAVYVDAMPDVLGELIHRLRKQGFRGKILTTEMMSSPAMIEAIGDDAIGVLLVKSVMEEGREDSNSNPLATAFIKNYREKYGATPDIFAAEAYDSIYVLAQALQGRPAIPSSVRKGLRDDVKDFDGVTGMIQFSATGSISRYPRVYRIAEDLSLSDYGQELKAKREETERKKKELLDRINNIRTQRVNEATDGDEAADAK